MKRGGRTIVDSKNVVVRLQREGLWDLLVSVTYQHELVCCGKGACRACGGKRAAHGPYWYAYFRAHGRMVSRYVGKRWNALDVDALRRLLVEKDPK